MRRFAYPVIVISLLASTACAVRKPTFQTYRMVKRDSGQVLVPPGVLGADLSQRTFWADVAATRSHCPGAAGTIGLQIRRKRLRVNVTKDVLLRQAPGWLSNWSAELESEGCIAPGAAPMLAGRIAESLPLNPRDAFRLLYSSQLHITSQIRLQVISPILRDGAAPYAPTVHLGETSGKDTSLTVVVKAPADLIGYETAWYSAQSRANGMGLTVAPLYAERHINGGTERRPRPAIDYFQFPPDAAFYRLFQKAGETEFTQLVIAARTAAELEQRAKTLETGRASCEILNGEMCIPIPRAVAVNLFLPAAVNGTEVMVRWGSTVGDAIREAGVRLPVSVLPKLAVYKPYHGRPVAVDFDRASPEIFNLTLMGGESISWK